uniref:BED-type domain-containing protein n=1 Tax=Salvator merianae TaxID=96440 RepID=A0A8D0E5B5_SALMN
VAGLKINEKKTKILVKNMRQKEQEDLGRKSAEPSPPAKRACHSSLEGSVVWRHFVLCPASPTYAACNHCKARGSRGQNVRRLGTTALWSHLRSQHPVVLPPDDSSRPRVPGSNLSGAVSATQQTLLPEQWLQRSGGTWGDRRGRALLTRFLVEMIALDDQPLAVVENIEGKKFKIIQGRRICRADNKS